MKKQATKKDGKRPASGRNGIVPSRVAFRFEPRPEDTEEVARMVEATGFFSDAEVAVARELVDERLAKGARSGYHFVFAHVDGAPAPAGYACFGPIPCTVKSYDLYWIVVAPEFQGAGLGRILLEKSESEVKDLGGTQVYIETSNRPQYTLTRVFYERCAYRCVAVLDDFYAPGDDKVVYVKRFAEG